LNGSVFEPDRVRTASGSSETNLLLKTRFQRRNSG
jgi:hypothetical protein